VHGGEFGLGERRSRRENCMEVSIQFLCTFTWIAVERIVYVHGL
jgi:hypothetical protein